MSLREWGATNTVGKFAPWKMQFAGEPYETPADRGDTARPRPRRGDTGDRPINAKGHVLDLYESEHTGSRPPERDVKPSEVDRSGQQPGVEPPESESLSGEGDQYEPYPVDRAARVAYQRLRVLHHKAVKAPRAPCGTLDRLLSEFIGIQEQLEGEGDPVYRFLEVAINDLHDLYDDWAGARRWVKPKSGDKELLRVLLGWAKDLWEDVRE